MMSTYFTTSHLIRCFQSLLTFFFVSICLFLLSILTYFTIRKHLLPVSHLVLPVSFGLPPSFHSENHSMKLPNYLVSSINLTDPIWEKSPLDISQQPYHIELHCQSPRSDHNRQLGSFFIQLILTSTSNQLILERSRMILFPYQSRLVHFLRTLMFLPLSIFGNDYDRWEWKETLIERLIKQEKPNDYLGLIQIHIIPSSFQLEQCSLHFHILDLTGLVYFYLYYPILTGCLSIFVLFSVYMTFYLIITALTMFNQMTNTKTKEC